MQKKMAEEAKKRLGILLDMGLWDEVTKAFEKNGTTCLSETKVFFGVCGINFTFDEMPEFKAVKEQFEEQYGAEVGVTTKDITFDDVINLYTSAKAKYRKKGVWLMNDETALALRKLKDADGNYIWNHNTDTILGKPVYISEFMPSSESGKKPIAFGDFSYYWIVNRSGIAVRTLDEKYALEHKTGYLAQEFLDARLIRPEAIKVIEMV